MDVNEIKNIFKCKEGNLYWRAGRLKGRKAGTRHSKDYIQTSYQSERLYVHRLIFAMHNGFWPEQIDHIDGDKANNRIENLRNCNGFQNQWNTKTPKTNKSGVKGDDFNKGKWRARIRFNGKRFNLGYYDDIELAELVVNEAREKWHKKFARKG